MTVRVFPADAVGGAPSYSGRALRQTLGVLIGLNSTARPLGGRTGVAPGTPDSTVSMSGTTWTVGSHGGVLDLEAAAQAGPYMYSIDANVTGVVNAAHATLDRVDSLTVKLSDPAESDGSAAPGVAIVYTAGTAGTLGGARGAAGGPPGVPQQSMELAQITVPHSGGGSPTVVFVAPYTAASSAPVVCRNSSEYPASPYNGQIVYDRALAKLLIYTGSAWSGNLTGDTGWITSGVLTAASGGSITQQRARKVGSLVSMYAVGTLPSTNTSGGSTGDYGNTTIATVTSAWQPSNGTGFGAANLGANFTFYLATDGTLQVVSGPAGGFTSGDPFSFTATYFID